LFIGKDGIKMDQGKTVAIEEWPVPRKVKDVQRFLGLTNFYQRFVEGFSKIAAPMNKLLRKDQEWEWKEEQQKAFEELKARFTTIRS